MIERQELSHTGRQRPSLLGARELDTPNDDCI